MRSRPDDAVPCNPYTRLNFPTIAISDDRQWNLTGNNGLCYIFSNAFRKTTLLSLLYPLSRAEWEYLNKDAGLKITISDG